MGSTQRQFQVSQTAFKQRLDIKKAQVEYYFVLRADYDYSIVKCLLILLHDAYITDRQTDKERERETNKIK